MAGEVKVVLWFLLAAVMMFGENLKLYLKDGGYHLVREYQVQGDRVRFYSIERSEWEEMPVALVDLDKTERARKLKDQEEAKELREESDEEKAQRELRREINSIPADTGVYYDDNGKIETVSAAQYQVVTDKKRKALQVLSPIPLVPGRASVVIKGDHSDFVVHENRPNFYMRLEKQERFGIVSLERKKNLRVVENISIVPVAKQAIENRKQMETFQQELADGLYKVWPEKPLTPGEYALVEYADTGDMNDMDLIVWDFAYRPAVR